MATHTAAPTLAFVQIKIVFVFVFSTLLQMVYPELESSFTVGSLVEVYSLPIVRSTLLLRTFTKIEPETPSFKTEANISLLAGYTGLVVVKLPAEEASEYNKVLEAQDPTLKSDTTPLISTLPLVPATSKSSFNIPIKKLSFIAPLLIAELFQNLKTVNKYWSLDIPVTITTEPLGIVEPILLVQLGKLTSTPTALDKVSNSVLIFIKLASNSALVNSEFLAVAPTSLVIIVAILILY